MDEHGDYLFKYALSRLRDPVKAEDAVQDTFLAALKGGKNFEGRRAASFRREGGHLVGHRDARLSRLFELHVDAVLQQSGGEVRIIERNG